MAVLYLTVIYRYMIVDFNMTVLLVPDEVTPFDRVDASGLARVSSAFGGCRARIAGDPPAWKHPQINSIEPRLHDSHTDTLDIIVYRISLLRAVALRKCASEITTSTTVMPVQRDPSATCLKV